jgi:hypothetical protein
MSSVKIIFEGRHRNDGNHLESVLSETDRSYRQIIPFREQEDETTIVLSTIWWCEPWKIGDENCQNMRKFIFPFATVGVTLVPL